MGYLTAIFSLLVGGQIILQESMSRQQRDRFHLIASKTTAQQHPSTEPRKRAQEKKVSSSSILAFLRKKDYDLCNNDKYVWVQVDENVNYQVTGIKSEPDLGANSDHTLYEKPQEKNVNIQDKGGCSAVDESVSRGSILDADNYDEEEHPMRTDEWVVDVRLSPMLLPTSIPNESKLFPESPRRLLIDNNEQKNEHKRRGLRRKRQVLKFSRNGFVVLIENDNYVQEDPVNLHVTSKGRFNGIWHWSKRATLPEINSSKLASSPRVTKVGQWRIDVNGISWDIPVKLSTGERTILHYHADLHLNKFQKQPRMFRGIVSRDRFAEIHLLKGANRKWIWSKDLFRPVVATFTAEGIGKDTVDTSYKNRGFGLGGG